MYYISQSILWPSLAWPDNMRLIEKCTTAVTGKVQISNIVAYPLTCILLSECKSKFTNKMKISRIESKLQKPQKLHP